MSNHQASGPIDQTKLAELRALERPGKEGFFAKFLGVFLADAEKQVERIRRAAQERDHEAVAIAAHTLKGSSYYVGAGRLADLCRRLEDLAEQGVLEGEPAAAVERELAEVSAVLAAEAAKAKS
ncbi:MAG TPA: Hpt domain-containing protein [Actinomycetota bacterium]|nr:Hpt domain-containing protein [Actinomycetota bacterium]